MTPAHPRLSSSNLKYLLVLFTLRHEAKGIRCVDVAQALCLSKPSVHTMMNTLMGMELIHKDHYGAVFLTPAGLALARTYQRYFEALHAHFSPLLPTQEDVRAAAYALMAEIPPNSLEHMLTGLRAKAGEKAC